MSHNPLAVVAMAVAYAVISIACGALGAVLMWPLGAVEAARSALLVGSGGAVAFASLALLR